MHNSMLPALLLILKLCKGAMASVNFGSCLSRLQNGEFGWAVEGAVYANGTKASNASEAVGLTYNACIALCGSGYEAFDEQTFASQMTTWLLPWLALISQLPYGADDALKNFEAMLLCVGSPMLAAYSLALAVTSNRWMVDRFRRSNYPNSSLAAKVMSNLQQVYITLPQEEDVIPSLIILRENDEWWRRLAYRLDYTGPKWTLATIMSMVYVALAYLLTWVVASKRYSGGGYSGGQSLGSLWLSLLPIVVCYLQLSPKTDLDKINEALSDANETIFVPTAEGKLIRRHRSQTITIQIARRDLVDEDRICPAPVWFYARFHRWFQAVLCISDAFDAASQHASNSAMVDVIPRTQAQVMEYCSFDREDDTYRYDLVNIYIKSAALALFLQWGTTGASAMSMYLSPTLGSQLLYGGLSTLVWLFAALSGILAHNFAASPNNNRNRRLIGGLAVALRQLAKIIAALNTGWIFASSLLQFANVENCCYCKTSALGLGSRAYGSFVFNDEQIRASKLYSAGGIIMASGAALSFIFAINILMKRPRLGPSIPRGSYDRPHAE